MATTTTTVSEANNNNKEFNKCLSHRSDYMDNDIEENADLSANEVKLMEKNVNNLRWKDSGRKCEGLMFPSSKKNSASYSEEFMIITEELARLKLRMDDFEDKQERLLRRGVNSPEGCPRPVQESAIKNRKQEVRILTLRNLLAVSNKSLWRHVTSRPLHSTQRAPMGSSSPLPGTLRRPLRTQNPSCSLICIRERTKGICWGRRSLWTFAW